MNRIGSAGLALKQASACFKATSTPLHPQGGLRGVPLRHPASLRSESPEAMEGGPEQPSGLGRTQPQRSEDGLGRARAAVQPGLVLASDAFFPFDDCVTLAAKYGVNAIVQPGGSIRDEDSIRKCNELGITMMFTGERHFKH